MADIKTLVEDVKNAYFDSLPYEIDVAIMERNGGATDTAFSEASAKVDALFAILDALAEAHQAEVARLTRENEWLAKDAARLDWLVAQLSDRDFREIGLSYRCGDKDVRAAIDAALAGASGAQEENT